MYQFWQIQHVKSQQEHLVTVWQGNAIIRLASDKRYSKSGSANENQETVEEWGAEIAKFNFQDPGSDSIEPS